MSGAVHERTMVGFRENATGLLATDRMGSHIVDWMPDAHESDETVARHEFTASKHMAVTNAFCVRGLELLAQMLRAAGRDANATRVEGEAAALKHAMMARMWNGSVGGREVNRTPLVALPELMVSRFASQLRTPRPLSTPLGSAFCDGVCAEVGGNSLVMTNMFTLAFGLVPAEYVAAAWRGVAAWGLEQMGDYGAFWYQAALAGSYYAPPRDAPAEDDGSALLAALNKCDVDSWCAGLRDESAGMRLEPRAEADRRPTSATHAFFGPRRGTATSR